MPTRERFTASETFLIAPSWPMICDLRESSIRASFEASSSSMRETGMPVHRPTTAAIS